MEVANQPASSRGEALNTSAGGALINGTEPGWGDEDSAHKVSVLLIYVKGPRVLDVRSRLTARVRIELQVCRDLEMHTSIEDCIEDRV